MKHRPLPWYLILLAATGFLPATTSACATCFGRSDSAMAEGMNIGIMVLLAFILSVLSAIAGFIFFLARRSTMTAPEASAIPRS